LGSGDDAEGILFFSMLGAPGAPGILRMVMAGWVHWEYEMLSKFVGGMVLFLACNETLGGFKSMNTATRQEISTTYSDRDTPERRVGLAG